MVTSNQTAAQIEFEELVSSHYQALYQFAFSLTRSESDASDLTQQTFYVFAVKGHQLRDHTKAKTWLFTTLHRQFLEACRRQIRFPHFEFTDVDSELPTISPERLTQSDSMQVLRALSRVDHIYQSAVSLFYLEECSYKEVAEILRVPIGTVKSRIARGLAQLQKLLMDRTTFPTSQA